MKEGELGHEVYKILHAPVGDVRMRLYPVLCKRVMWPGVSLLIADFEDFSDWQQKESRGSGAVVVKNVQVELNRSGRLQDQAFLRIVDRSATDHWFWLHK